MKTRRNIFSLSGERKGIFMKKKMKIWRRMACLAFCLFVTGSAQSSQKVLAAEEVSFSAESGAYEKEFTLSLQAGEDTIYYTLDGTNPADESNSSRIQYTDSFLVTDGSERENLLSAIDPVKFDSVNVTWKKKEQKFASTITAPSNDAVDKATVVRAVSQDKEGNYSAVAAATYFVGDMADHISGIQQSCEASGTKLAIMSIVVNPEDFFDEDTGIYVHGTIFQNALEEYLKTGTINSGNAVDVARGLDANYKQRGRDWERNAHIDYMESDGEETDCVLSQECGIRIQGNYSRSDLQKGLRLYAREDYGKKNFKYAFFGEDATNSQGKVIDKFKKLTLRNGGNCAFTAKFNDSYWQSMIQDLDCETQSSRVCVVYLNGEYWGIYVLQEDYNNNDLEQNYDVNKDDVVIYKGDAESYELGYKLDDGELPEGITDESYYFYDLLDFFDTHDDLTAQEDYEAFEKLVDVESVRDYFAVNVWINNKWDWPGKNWSAWKVTATDDTNPYADGRWRLCLYDLDFGGVSGASDATTNTIKEGNYKDYGLLDMNTDNPVVKMFAYLMTNEGFRKDFEDKLTDLTQNQFESTAALEQCEKYCNIYSPLYDQFFTRYFNSADSDLGSKDNALNGYYASAKCIKDFLAKRAKQIPKIIKWVDKFYETHTSYNSGVTETEAPAATQQPEASLSPSVTVEPQPDATLSPSDNASPQPAETTTPQQGADASLSPETTDAPATEMPAIEKVSPLKSKVTARKGTRKIVIQTEKKAKVTVILSEKILLSGKQKKKKVTLTANQNGKAVVKLSAPLKKGMKWTVRIQKSGFQTKTVTKKI
jgi:hypothetical protein